MRWETLAHRGHFHDPVRLEKLLFDGTLDPEGSALPPDRSRPGLGLELKRADATEYQLTAARSRGSTWMEENE